MATATTPTAWGLRRASTNPRASPATLTGDLYVADTGNNTIRKVTPAGVVTTLAGKAGVSGTADGRGAAARFNQPQGIACDPHGDLYVTDLESGTIRKITPAGVVTTVAGTPRSPDSYDESGPPPNLYGPSGVVCYAGNLYVADADTDAILKVTLTR